MITREQLIKRLKREKAAGIDPLLIPSEASVYLTINVCTLGWWRHKNKKPDYLKINGKIRYRLSDLDKFIEESTRICQKQDF